MDKQKILKLVEQYATALVAVHVESEYYNNAKNDQQAARSLVRKVNAENIFRDLYRQIDEALQ